MESATQKDEICCFLVLNVKKGNHFATVCKSSQDSTSSLRRSKKVNEVEYEYEDTDGRNISDDPDGNNYLINSVRFSSNRRISTDRKNIAETGVDMQPRAREINSINFSKKIDIHIKAKYKTNEMIMKIDSATQCNVISLETIKKLKTEPDSI